MLWWHWLVIGLILVALEMAASGGFYIIFFGIAALAIAGLHALDWAGPIWLQLVLFSSISIVSLLFFRSPLLKWMGLDGPGKDVDSLVGDIEVIKQSEARKQQQINEAEGEAAAITSVATATAAGIRSVAEAITLPGGQEAVQLRVAEQYIGQFGELAKKGNTIVLPANVADVGSMVALAMKLVRKED